MVALKKPEIPVPPAMQHLPLTSNGYHKPWFVRKNDLREPDPKKFQESMNRGRCWICGGVNKKEFVFVTEIKSAIQSISLEPPCHPDCALYSIQVCPFLLLPNAKRRTAGLPDYLNEAKAPEIAMHNPGAYVLTHVRKFAFKPVNKNSPTKWAIWADKSVSCQSLWAEGKKLEECPSGMLDKVLLQRYLQEIS